MIKRNNIRLLIVVIIYVFALVLRLLYLWSNPILNRDSIIYCETAEKWHQSNSPTIAMREYFGSTPSGYVFILKKGLDYGIPVDLWGRIIGSISFFLFFITTYFIGRSIFKGYGAELLLLITMTQPDIGQLSFTLLRDPLCLTFYSISFLAIIKYCTKHNSFLWCTLFSVSTTLAFFLRYESLELFILLAVISFVILKDKKRTLYSSWINCLLVFFLLSLCLCFLMDYPVNMLASKMLNKLHYTICY